MSYNPDDTICAIGTASGGAARGMVRLSGANAAGIASRIFEPDNGLPLKEVFAPTATTGRLRIGLDDRDRYVPCDLYFWPGTRSYSREPVAEFHTIGSLPVLQAVVAAVCKAGARLAEPGEFTLRAYLAGRIDLTQAEAVLGVVDAAGSDELSTALAQLAGGIAHPLHQLRESLLQLLAELEAGLDFVDEDIRFISQSDVLRQLQSASALLNSIAQQMESRYAAGELPQVVLVGPPNAGKSSLFNALVEAHAAVEPNGQQRTAAAIVSPQRGTTRDYLTANVTFGVVCCELVDTAGVEDGDEPATGINAQAQGHAMERRQRATVRALCLAAPELVGDAAAASQATSVVKNCDLLVITKSDLVPSQPRLPDELRGLPVVETSSPMQQGIAEFGSAVRQLLNCNATPSTVTAATAERCRESIRLAADGLDATTALVSANAGDELVAADLRAVLAELGKVVGVVYTDDLLDRIFKTFCIGK